MSAQTFSARAVATIVAKRTGRPCDAKRVRAWAREHMARMGDEVYTVHAYTSRERDLIVDALVKRAAARATGTDGRASSASRGRRGPVKAPAKRAARVKVQPDAGEGTTGA